MKGWWLNYPDKSRIADCFLMTTEDINHVVQELQQKEFKAVYRGYRKVVNTPAAGKREKKLFVETCVSVFGA